MLLTRSQIQSAVDLQTKAVPVPEWGGEVLVRGMSGSERDAFEAASLKIREKDADAVLQNFRARLVAATAVDADGQYLFAPADIEWLGNKSGIALDRVYEESMKLSGFRKEDVDELVKKSEATADGSGSASPGTAASPTPT